MWLYDQMRARTAAVFIVCDARPPACSAADGDKEAVAALFLARAALVVGVDVEGKRLLARERVTEQIEHLAVRW